MTALLALRDVTKAFTRGRSERRILDAVSLVVYAGQFVTVFGERAAGKTTLLRIAAGFEQPDRGSVMFEGRDLRAMSATSLASIHRSSIAWVDHIGATSDGLTMIDYVGLPLLLGHRRPAVVRLATAALEKVGAGDCALAHWSDLSDAERTQVAIAQALVREPQLIVLDDPTAGLDIIERARILRLLRSTADDTDTAVLMAVPDVPSMIKSHEVFSLSGGRLLGAASRPDEPGMVVDLPRRERSA